MISQGTNKNNIKFASARNCHRFCLFQIDNKKIKIFFHFRDNNGKLWVEVTVAAFLDAYSDRRCPHSKR